MRRIPILSPIQPTGQTGNPKVILGSPATSAVLAPAFTDFPPWKQASTLDFSYRPVRLIYLQHGLAV